jgi:hypothetical protein
MKWSRPHRVATWPMTTTRCPSQPPAGGAPALVVHGRGVSLKHQLDDHQAPPVSSRPWHQPEGHAGTHDPANFVQCGVRPFTGGYALLRPYLVYLQVKDALAATGEVVPAGQGDGELRETLAALRDSGFAGFMSLEPHLARAGRFGGFTGPEGFVRAATALKFLLNEASISWR